MAVNKVPIVNAGLDVSIQLPVNQVVLSGTATDPDGTIASVAWTKTAGGTCIMSGQNTLTLTVTAMVLGSYTFKLTATDNKGATSSDSVKVTVTRVIDDVAVDFDTKIVTITYSDGTIKTIS